MTRTFSTKDIFFMEQALVQAHKAMDNDEVPIGAIVVDPDGQRVATGYNCVEKRGCQIAHAEMIALKKACTKVGDWRLDGYWVYVTLEPWSMVRTPHCSVIILTRMQAFGYTTRMLCTL